MENPAKTQTLSGESRQYLSFVLDHETYAFEVLKVREVLESTRITRVPKTAPFLVGVINLRGSVVPVVDLRLKFELKAADTTIDTSIIIAETVLDGETLVIGALVDAVKAVVRLDPSEIEETPKVGMRVARDFVQAIGRKNDQFLILLDADRIFTRDELDATTGVGH